MTPSGPSLSPAVATARLSLLHRATRVALRARRARIGSNERKHCLEQAAFLSQCVHEIDNDKALRKHLERARVTDRGWRALAGEISTHLRARAQEKFGA